jgi:hypothetical protein
MGNEDPKASDSPPFGDKTRKGLSVGDGVGVGEGDAEGDGRGVGIGDGGRLGSGVGVGPQIPVNFLIKTLLFPSKQYEYEYCSFEQWDVTIVAVPCSFGAAFSAHALKEFSAFFFRTLTLPDFVLS